MARTGAAFLDRGRGLAVAQDHRADRLLVEVQGQAERCRPRTRAARSRRRRAGPTRGRCRRRPRGRDRPAWSRRRAGSPARFFWRAAVMSPVLMVSSAMTLVPSRPSERLTELGETWRTEPSMTVSPIWVTMPPSTVGSTITTMSTSLPVAALSDAARRAFWSSVSSTAERTSATTGGRRSTAVSSSRRSTMAGSSRTRPVPTTSETRPTVVVGGLAAEQVLDDLLAAGGREVRVGERVCAARRCPRRCGRTGTARPGPR